MAKPRAHQTAKPPTPFAIWSVPFTGPWLVLAFRPTTLWSLRTSMSTSSGGKTLLVPTPYSFKLALVDACIQHLGVDHGVRLFELLRGRPVRISPPAQAVVSATLVKLRKLERSDSGNDESDEDDGADVRMFVPTVGFREYVSFSGTGSDGAFHIAIARAGMDEGAVRLVSDAARGVTYSGKRGGFLQFEAALGLKGHREVDELSAGEPFTLPLSQVPQAGTSIGTIQPLDELAASAEWDRVSTFGPKPVRVAQAAPGRDVVEAAIDRVYVPSAVPYRLVKTTRNFAAYRRVDLP
jgi:hypothetical protein